MESSMSCMEMFKYSLSKITFEFIGTMFLTMFFTTGSNTIILAGLFLMTCFCWKISGSHFNPAVTLAMMLRRGEAKFPISRGVFYIVFQLAGGYIGACLVNFFTLDLKILEYTDPFIMRATVQELLASFTFVVFFLSQTDASMLFSKEAAINCLILASCYVGTRAIWYGQATGTCYTNGNGDKVCTDVGNPTTTYGIVANPAIALGICLSGLFNEGFSAWTAVYLYPVVPFVGAFLAFLFFEFVYKKTYEVFHPDAANEAARSGNGMMENQIADREDF